MFKKNSSETYLWVMVSSDMRLANCDNCCRRWFVTFDGQECAPVPIDGLVYIKFGAGNREKNLHRPRVITGHCKISKSGQVNVAFNVGNCQGDSRFADALTGFKSSTRIYIEEVGEPQK